MELKYFGANCIGLSTKDAKVLVDPLGKSYGVTTNGFSPDITLVTNTAADTAAGDGFVIDSPGEYEVKGVSVYGIPARKHTDENGKAATMYKVIIDGIHVLITGLIYPELSDEQKEAIDHVDIMCVPVGGHGQGPDAKGAAQLSNAFEASIIVPTHYADSKVTYEIPQDTTEGFVKELGVESEPVESIKIKQKDIDPEVMEVKILKRS